MSIFVVTIVTGEKLIAQVKELFEDEAKTRRLGFCFIRPFILTLYDVDDDNVSVKFENWNPFTTDVSFQVPDDIVVAINNPNPLVKETYLDKMKEIGEFLEDSPSIEPEVV